MAQVYGFGDRFAFAILHAGKGICLVWKELKIGG
jgi:hypothetical protein